MAVESDFWLLLMLVHTGCCTLHCVVVLHVVPYGAVRAALHGARVARRRIPCVVFANRHDRGF